MTGPRPRTLFSLSHLIPITNLHDRYYCYFHFIKKLRHSSKSHNQKRQHQNFQKAGLQNPYLYIPYGGSNNYSVNHRRKVRTPSYSSFILQRCSAYISILFFRYFWSNYLLSKQCHHSLCLLIIFYKPQNSSIYVKMALISLILIVKVTRLGQNGWQIQKTLYISDNPITQR